MLELLLLRHGQTDWNAQKKIMGREPVPLNTVGRAQARRLARGLKDIQIYAVYVSPTKRTMQTAQLLLKGRESIPLVQEEGLTEIDYKGWVGRNIADVYNLPEFQTYLKKPLECVIPGGERISDVSARAYEVVEKIRSKHDGQRVIVLTHADIIRMILIKFLGISFDDWQRIAIDNASMSVIRFKEERSRIITVNCYGDWGRYFNV